ncbi:hypothetical protein Tco_0640534 [Tanacetum coccineum]
MSADSAVTYTSVHSEARSWSIPSEDPYEEAARQLLEQAPRSPEYVPDPMELEDHVPVYIPEPEHPEDLGHLTRVDFFTREIQKFCTQHHDAQKEHGSCEKLRYDVLREVAWLTSKRVWETRKAWLGLRLHCMALEHRVTVLEIESVKFYGLLPASSRQGSEPRPAPKQLATHYSEFLKCKPLDFKGTKGVVGLTRWFEKMESVFSISNCTAASQVKLATCTLQDDALTWWNAHVKTTTPEAAHAMPWAALKKMMTDKYCPRGEIKKIKTKDV